MPAGKNKNQSRMAGMRNLGSKKKFLFLNRKD